MFEVLLQAEKALASGALDQAERSYWQLIVLDPTNAIAVAGLARVSLDRGDQRLARTFAERALVIDPDNLAAKRIVETLEGRGVQPPASDEPDLPLLAAHRLEALGRRRAPGQTGPKGAETHAPVPAPVPAPAPAAEAKPPKGRKADPEETPKPLPPLRTEPLKERRPAGRQAATAATAAAEAAARPQAPRGARAHQALGDRARRHRLPEAMKPPRSEDPFAVAESEAAVEAVDEADDVVIAHPFEPAEGGAQTDELGQVLGAVGATDEEESIALRVALVSDAAQREAAELEAADLDAAELRAAERREPELNEAELEAAELEAAEALAAEALAAEALAVESVGPMPSRRIDLVALEAELRAAELRAAELRAAEPRAAELREAELRVAQGEPVELEAAQTEQAAQATPAIEEAGAVEPVESIAPARAEIDPLTSESADAEAADVEAELAEAEPVPAELAMAQRVSEQIAEAEFEAAQLEASGVPIERPNRPAPHPATAHETTEEDAEAAALREALAVVLGNDTGDVPTEDGERAPHDVETAGAQPSADADADNEPPLDWSDAGGDTAGSEATPKRHRHGLLRRFLGD